MSKEAGSDKTARGRYDSSDGKSIDSVGEEAEQVEHLRIILQHDVQIMLCEITKKRGISLRELLAKEAIPQGLKLYTTAHADEFNRQNAP